ncbi:DNA primase [Streptomyces sp. NPDC021080]|uniref:DNA primase n=1 Tax=Streptomyces sp. NPDC021080 TaxID=3365110 RepID=UPI00379FC789
MTQPTDSRGEHLRAALSLASSGVPVLPLRAGKVPFGNCPACAKNSCGGRPNMKISGPCTCPRPCHGWAAASTDPGGAGLTVVDLDNADAIARARANLPATRTVPTTRGEHWIYRGAMQSANGVRPGVDIKSLMAYACWLGPGTGAMAALPDAVRALAVKPSTVHGVPQGLSVPLGDHRGTCPHRTPTYLARGIAMAEQRITRARQAVHATVYHTFLAVLSTHGRCGCLTDAHIAHLFAAAQAKGETARHCADAWTNALTRLRLSHA